MLDHEKLTGYQVQLKFLGWVDPLLDEVQRQSGQRRGKCEISWIGPVCRCC